MSAYADDSDIEELLHVFTSEGRELLDEADPRLIELQECAEQYGEVDGDALNCIFRIFHTIKGSACFLGLGSLQQVTHEAETLLDYYRKGARCPAVEHIRLLLRTTDFLRVLMGSIEKSLHDRGYELEAERLMGELARAVRQGGDAVPETADGNRPLTPESVPGDVVTDDSRDTDSAEPETAAGEGDPFAFRITEEMTEQYVREALELLDSLEQTILEIETAPDNQELIDRAFRCLHTLKGNSGLLGYGDLERLSHKTESLFDHLRSGEMRADIEITKMVLSILDYLRSTVIEVSGGGSGTIRGCDTLIGFIDEVIRDAAGVSGESAPVPEEGASSEAGVSAGCRADAEIALYAPEIVPEPVPEPPVEAARPVKPPEPSVPPRELPLRKVAETASRPEPLREQAAAPKDIRVDLEKVDKLVDLIGELALAEMMVAQNPALRHLEDEEFDRAVHHLDRVISELQYVSMSLRMVPIAATFRKLIRLVHDLSYKSGKSVKLATLGEETEVDKTVVDLIADPLVHIVRNAIDHGIERPEDRKSAGKRETGTVTIEAKHEGGEVWIAISDDGRGLSREKILKKARQMGMVEGDGAELRDEDVFKLIFEPGFSTAEEITEVSGRGVGMDVARRNLERINGQVDITSTPGQGSRFTLRTPLTLALMDGMLVQVGSARYIIPLLSIRECMRPRPEDITVTPDGQEIVRVRDELLPVMRMHLLHAITPEHMNPEDAILLIVEHRGVTFSIMVDAVLGQQQAVIKGLSDYVDTVRGVSGCTILGDGAVSLILDIGSLWEMVSQEGSREGVMAGW